MRGFPSEKYTLHRSLSVRASSVVLSLSASAPPTPRCLAYKVASREHSIRGVSHEAEDDQDGNDDWRNEPALHGLPPVSDDLVQTCAACAGSLGVQSRAKRLARAICAAVRCEVMRSYPERACCR